MMTERRFSVTYTSLWREIMPSADNFIRHINLAASRFVMPYEADSSPGLNGAINESAFRLCRLVWSDGRDAFLASADEGRLIWNDVCKWLGEDPAGKFAFTNVVWNDLYQIADSIFMFLRSYSSSVIEFAPSFPGCGVISQCFGDVIIDGMLVEIKAGDRGFRATDLRQLFTYCALSQAAGQSRISSICLMNPRWGVCWISSVEDAATSCGASSSVELLDEVVRGAVLLGVSK